MTDIFEKFQELSLVITTIVTIASTVTAITDTPSDNSFKGKLYKIIELLALVTQKTKQK